MRKVHFKTNVLLKDIIGKGLINDDNLAVIELVKNSFDAKASKVEVIFKYLTPESQSNLELKEIQRPTLIIQDNGIGMNDNDIENKWLNIAYSEKKGKSDITSQVFAGDKGVGRFSCDRLGRYLNLYTKKTGEPIYHVKIDWESFEKGDINTTIQSIPVTLNTISESQLKDLGYKIGEQGTIMEMSGLRMNWLKLRVKELRNQFLAKLINPSAQYTQSAPKLFLTVSDYKDLSGEIDNKVFERLSYRTTSIEAYTEYNKEKNELIVTTILRHKGQNIVAIKEKNNRFLALKNVKIVIYYLNSYARVRFLKETGERTKDYGSIFLFLNGFRVSPYGQKDDDWLGIEMRHAQGHNRYFSARDLVGRIEITDFEGLFKPISSREGLEKDQTYRLLINKDAVKDGYNDDENDKTEYGLFYQILTALEKYVVNGLKWDSPVSKDYLNEFEEEAMSESDLTKELYAESEEEKDKRSFEAIQSILRTRKGEILNITINQDLLYQLSLLEEEKSKKFLKSLEKFTGSLENTTSSTLKQIKHAFKQKEEELAREKAKLSEEEKKRKEVEEKLAQEERKRKEAEEKAKKESEKAKDEELKRKKAQLDAQEAENKRLKAENERLKAEQKAKEAEGEAQKAKEAEEKAKQEAEAKKEELKIEQLKTEFYRKQSTPDTDALIHHVKNNIEQVKELILGILDQISKNLLDTNTLQEDLFNMLQYVNKALKATDLILEVDLEQADNQEVELPTFIEGYIKNYPKIVRNTNVKLSTEIDGNSFKVLASKLELAVALDNLIDNAIKWHAKNILVKVQVENKGNLCRVIFSDDGDGLSDKYKENPDKIFTFKETAHKSGTGFGLYVTRQILQRMNASIQVAAVQPPKGLAFNLIFH